MAKAQKKAAIFGKNQDLKLDSSNKEVGVLQSLLTSLGYLQGPGKTGKFCRFTERAVRRYQRFYHLKVDGIVGSVTKAHMEQPRCGVADIPERTGAAASFVLRGCKYNKNNLTYAFLNGTSDLPGSRERAIVRQAFAAWANVTNLTFSEVTRNQGPDLRIAWRSGDHGDGSSFDGPGRTLAHAFFPPPCGGVSAGDLHFDEAETWIDDPSQSGIVLLQVAIHEIGHLLGLSHSQDESAIMFAFYSPDRTNLAQDDISGIQALYGEPVQEREQALILSAEANGTLARGGDEQFYEVQVPQTLAVSIDGPDDADFDLYVRKGQKPTVTEFDFRAFTVSADEKIVLPVEPGARYFVMVRSFSGTGNYKLNIEPGS